MAKRRARKRGRLLKDCTAADLMVAVDYAIDQGLMVEDLSTASRDACTTSTESRSDDAEPRMVRLGPIAYLKYATQDQIIVLRDRLPHQNGVLIFGTQRRTVVLFNYHVLREVLAFLVDEPSKYMRLAELDPNHSTNVHTLYVQTARRVT